MKFTIELNPTDEQFNAILAILKGDTPKPKEEKAEEVEAVEAEDVVVETPSTKEKTVEEVPMITAKDVRAKAASKTKSNRKLGAEIKAYIEELGYDKITAIEDQDHLNKVYAFIEGL